MITLITTTGWRQKAFSLCEHYIKRQTYKGDLQWLVVSDDPPDKPTRTSMGQEYIQCPLIWRRGINTQRYSLAAAIPYIKGDKILIIEDDDVYFPDYIKVMSDMLEHADLTGEGGVTYYSLIVRGHREMGNYKHASLCQTGFRRSYLPKFESAVHSANTYIDIELWGRARAAKDDYLLFSGRNLCVGMKGVPGRGGIGLGHHETGEFIRDNSEFAKLKELLGPKDAEVYIQMLQGAKPK